MFNFFYHPGYAKRKKVILTLKFQESILINKLIDFTYYFNLIFPNRYITNGAHKCINNTLKALKTNKTSAYNKNVYQNTYILQFDWYGEKVLNDLLKSPIVNKKILIGPLYTTDQLKRLSSYIAKHSFIKIVAASKYAVNKSLSERNINLQESNFCVIPTGVTSRGKISFKTRNEKCLIYYKNREQKDLKRVIEFLNNKNINYDLFEYGKYSNNKLISAAKNNKFCIMLNSSESQGIAVQEILSMNLPMYVWDLPTDSKNYFASSIPYFDERCGMVTNSYEQFLDNYETFINQLSTYKPREYILDKLSFDVFLNNLQSEFDEINL